MTSLSFHQIQQYENDGFLLVSDLIPEDLVANAVSAMWSCLKLSPDDPSSWPAGSQGVRLQEHSAMTACFTPEVLEAAAILSHENHPLKAPEHVHSINVFPKPGEWKWHGMHIDHAIKNENHRVFPKAFGIAVMIYLNNVAPKGGGTVLWPGSHRRLEELARRDPVQYEFMWRLNADLNKVDLGDPVELLPQGGDVLFYHYLVVHSGSNNTSDRPRFALNHKW